MSKDTDRMTLIRRSSPAVWPDLAKFLSFGKKFKVFGNFWRINLALGKILNLLGPIIMLLGKYSLFYTAKFWKIIYPSLCNFLLGFCEKHNFLSKTAMAPFWASLQKFGLLLFQHLVTLLRDQWMESSSHDGRHQQKFCDKNNLEKWWLWRKKFFDVNGFVCCSTISVACKSTGLGLIPRGLRWSVTANLINYHSRVKL